ncbi:unnamed protein product [Adineta steineri]|uniref:BZIP domain-containing protein n=1 Tax=Adineta steineri TaxID=433720 RepID=A0A814T703_9BILA|nr:unnamed protein product [Adineta steineri]CAF3646846.1 unnamed protein product [Adineta steineri]CAF4026085.1 unnamed protein product [Adineta steineri]
MSNTKYTRKSIQPGSDGYVQVPAEISCVFRFGKDNLYEPYIKYEPINELEIYDKSKLQIDNKTLAAIAEENAAIISIKNNLKLSSSLQVHSSDGSLISVFNTEAVPSASSTYTNLETSFDLPIDDNTFIQQILDNTSLTTSLPDIDFEDELFKNFPDDSFTDFDPLMTIQELTNVPMEQSQHYPQQDSSPAFTSHSINDETTISSINSPQSEDSERDDINRRGVKKSGGPVRKLARFGNKQVIKYSNEYHDRRIKNNEAVKKSRMKAKEKQQSSDVQMNKLTEENRTLNDRVDLLMKELQVLRSLYKELKHDSTVEVNNTH